MLVHATITVPRSVLLVSWGCRWRNDRDCRLVVVRVEGGQCCMRKEEVLRDELERSVLLHPEVQQRRARRQGFAPRPWGVHVGPRGLERCV